MLKMLGVEIAAALATAMFLGILMPEPASAQFGNAPRVGYCPPGTCAKDGSQQARNARNCSAANCRQSTIRTPATGSQTKRPGSR